MRKIYSLLIYFIAVLSWQQSFAEDQIEPTLQYGANTFIYRCALCHGSEGYGDGLMSLSLKDYPETNLHKNQHGEDEDSLRESIVMGGSKGSMSKEMPPWGNELTYIEVESLILFMKKLYLSPKDIKGLVEKIDHKGIDGRHGKKLYGNYCALCHGTEGMGDGKMAKTIKDPPPFNLTKSVMPPEYLKLIITRGGEEMKRSERMPPWGEQFSESEIDSLVKYLMTLRE